MGLRIINSLLEEIGYVSIHERNIKILAKKKGSKLVEI